MSSESVEAKVDRALARLSQTLSSPPKPRKSVAIESIATAANRDQYRLALETRSIDAAGFLKRLSTFTPLSWLPKPRKDLLGPVECASWGWCVGNSKEKGVEVLECGSVQNGITGCGKMLAIRFQNNDDQLAQRFHQELKSAHDDSCRFSKIPVDTFLVYTFPGPKDGITPAVATSAFKQRFNSLTKFSWPEISLSETPVAENVLNLLYAIIAQDILTEQQRAIDKEYAELNPNLPRTPKKSTSPRNSINPGALRKSNVGLVRRLPSTLDRVPEEALIPLLCAMMGWDVGYDETLFKLDSSLAKKNPMLECSLCHRTIPIKSLSNLNPELEHREYCPWIFNGNTPPQQTEESRFHYLWREGKKRPGWISTLDQVLGGPALINGLLHETEIVEEPPKKKIRVSFGNVLDEDVEQVAVNQIVHRIEHALNG